MIIIAAQQSSDSLRAEYLMDMSVYKGHPKMFVFVDELRSDKRDSMQKFAYSLRGNLTFSRKLLVWGERVSTIAGVSWGGLSLGVYVVDCKSSYPKINSTFTDYVQIIIVATRQLDTAIHVYRYVQKWRRASSNKDTKNNEPAWYNN